VEFNKKDITEQLLLEPPDNLQLHNTAMEVKAKHIGRKIFLRGLIEYSNICLKNCYYCGIRSHNTKCERYQLTNGEVIDAAIYAHKNRFASIVIQSGEISNKKFISTIENLLVEIGQRTNHELHITLSLGEQREETYHRWFEAGAHRYLLRIETSNPELYKKLHPGTEIHNFERRLESLGLLKKVGFQTGSGVMIGLPYQTVEHLADDLLFFRDFDIDMVGMGPYIEHQETPLYKHRHRLTSLQERLELSLNMVALLRIMMPDINIAATTAMQTIDPDGRKRALLAGANVMMPNITPETYKKNYLLYNAEPGLEDDAGESIEAMERNIRLAGDIIGYGEWGDSKHFKLRTSYKQ
jgi:biotin synthase